MSAALLVIAGCDTLRTLPLGPRPGYYTEVDSRPPGAHIWFDGNYLGRAPVTVEWSGHRYRGGWLRRGDEHSFGASRGAAEQGPQVSWLTHPFVRGGPHPDPPRYVSLPRKVTFDWEAPPPFLEVFAKADYYNSPHRRYD